jgi:hypothetical protein
MEMVRPMEIYALKVAFFERDINDLLSKYLPADQPIEELAVRLTAKGFTVSGVYPLFINVRFETQWDLGLENGQITARLSHFKAMGVPGNIFKSAIVKMIEEAAGAESWLRIQGDTLWIDIDSCAAKYAFGAKTHLKQLVCQSGCLILEGRSEPDA